MKIIILGAGQVGSTLAENLVGEDNDITLVDNESTRLDSLQDKHDLRVVTGSASSCACLARSRRCGCGFVGGGNQFRRSQYGRLPSILYVI